MPTTRIRPTVQLPNYKRLAVTGASGAAAAVNDSSDSSYVRRSADKAPLARFVLAAPTIPAGNDIATIVPGARLKQPTSVTPKMVTLAMSVPGTGKPVNEIAPVVNGPVVRAGSGTTAYTYSTPAGAGVAAGPTGPWSSLLSALAIRVNDGHKASDGNRATIYELFADVYYAARPSAAVTIAPTSPVTTTSYPVLTATLTALIESWQDGSGPAARGEVAYELKVFSAAQYGAGGFDPATSPGMWSTQGLTASLDYIDGSTPSSEAVAETPDRALPNGAYRAYARGRRNFAAAQFGAWASLDFTVAVAPPTSPTLTAAADDAAQRVALTITPVAGSGAASPLVSIERGRPVFGPARTNYITEPNSVSTWLFNPQWFDATTEATPPVPLPPGIPSCAKLVHKAGVWIGVTPTPKWAVSAGQIYTLSGFVHVSALSGDQLIVGFRTYNGAAMVRDGYGGAAITAVNGSFVRVSATVTIAAGEDGLSIYPCFGAGTSTVWLCGLMCEPSADLGPYFDGSYPGCSWAAAPNASVSVGTYADTEWAAMPRASDLPVAFGSPRVISDYEAPRGAALSYRANVEATVAGQQLVSAWTTAAVTGTLSSLGWNLKAPLDPELNLLGAAVNADPEYTQQEDAATFRPLGRKYPVVVSMALGGADGSLTLRARSDAEWATVEALRDYQGTLYLESPFGWGRYIRILSRSWVESGSASAPRRRVDVGFLEVAAP